MQGIYIRLECGSLVTVQRVVLAHCDAECWSQGLAHGGQAELHPSSHTTRPLFTQHIAGHAA